MSVHRSLFHQMSMHRFLFQIKAKNQLRVNGLSMSMYFLTYFTILIFIMILTSAGVLVLVCYLSHFVLVTFIIKLLMI